MRVAVIGAGLGGLATAAFLVRAGIEDVEVHEQATELGEIGAGIQVPPNAVRLLRRLGVADRLDDAGVRLETGWELRRWRDGRVLFTQQLGDLAEQRFGAPYYVAHRAGLLAALHGVLPDGTVRLGRRCTGVEQVGDQVRVTFEGGDAVTADAVVGADGIHSVVRGAVASPGAPTFSGTAAYRCLLPAGEVPPMALEPGFKVWFGPGRHLVHYPISGGREVNVVAIVPAGTWRTESWIAEGDVAGLLAQFEGWAPDVGALLSRAPRAWLYALYDREPLTRMAAGRIALLGDAAHPMLPFLAQGAAQAFEDAAVLALCLREAGASRVEPGLRRYQDARLGRVSEVQRQSRGRPDLYHLPDGPAQVRRDEELAAQDPLDHHAWLYEHDAEAALRGSGVASPLR
jgi:2-polyprenyl-6-methoxyphenol hydroxylase-like FAD-dependent oxidoreductase